MYVCAFSFRTAGEVFSAGDLDEANLTKDDVDDAELFELIQKVVKKITFLKFLT